MANVIQPPQNVRSLALMDIYGSSLAEFGTAYITRIADRWPTKVAAQLGAVLERNWGVGGSSLIQEALNSGWSLAANHSYTLLPSTPPEPDNFKPRRQLALLIHAFNDGRQKGSDANFRATYRAGLRAWINLMRASFFYGAQDAKLTYGTSWTSQSAAPSFGNVPYKSHGNTAATVTLDYNDSHWTGGFCTFYYLVRGDTTDQASATMSIDGQTIGSLTGTSLGVSGWYTLVAVRGAVPSGDHDVVCDFTGGSIRLIGVSMELSDLAAQTVIVGTHSTPAMPWNGTSDFTTTVKNNLNTDMQTVVGEFDRCSFVSLTDEMEVAATGLGNGDYIADDVHYNETGNDIVARKVLSVIRSVGVNTNGPLAPGIRSWAGTPGWSGPEGQVVYDTTNQILITPTGVTGRTWIEGSINRDRIRRLAIGVKGETVSRDVCTTAAAPATQTIYCGLVGFEAGDVITNLCACVSVAGAGTTPTLIKLGLVDTTGVVLAATANLAADSSWTSIGPKAFALTAPYTIATAGGYYLAILQNGTWGTTPMQILRTNYAAGADLAQGSYPRLRASGGTGKTDITGTLTLADFGIGAGQWLGWN